MITPTLNTIVKKTAITSQFAWLRATASGGTGVGVDCCVSVENRTILLLRGRLECAVCVLVHYITMSKRCKCACRRPHHPAATATQPVQSRRGIAPKLYVPGSHTYTRSERPSTNISARFAPL